MARHSLRPIGGDWSWQFDRCIFSRRCALTPAPALRALLAVWKADAAASR